MFAKHIVVADAQSRRLALVFQIHRRIANDTTRVEPVAFANARRAEQADLRPDDAVIAQLHARLNHGARPDGDIRAQFR